MKILLLGKNGQLGWELRRTRPENIDMIFCDDPKVNLCDPLSISECIRDNSPDYIINAAAYTAVDRAEQEKDLANRINYEAVLEIAKICQINEISLVQISTDFVFNGQSCKPYKPEDIPSPLSVYGKSKFKGEQAIREVLSNKALIIRTAWLYSSHGNNFVKTILRLIKEKETLSVVTDQTGTPTWANGLAKAVWTAIDKKLKGILHWTDAGVASWYDFAFAIQEEALKTGLLNKAIPIIPVPASKYPTPAKRPMYNILDKTSTWKKTGLEPIHWRIQLKAMLKELNI